ncbi:hypothetical protein HK097_001888 [Rhizophlyctis rosea]|uniref:Uncharacterized protein n=1 Tax=Rhizophlyctis rosea TaxID=64517 RepID=A0AAD5X6Q6_9FUNG|nr:hypothetical protein HK097_001888 [Rhizophlyctis rosea]
MSNESTPDLPTDADEILSTLSLSADTPNPYQERPIVYEGKELPHDENIAGADLSGGVCRPFYFYGGCPYIVREPSCTHVHIVGFNRANFTRTVFIQSYHVAHGCNADSLLAEMKQFGDMADFLHKASASGYFYRVTFKREEAAWNCMSKPLAVHGVSLKVKPHVPPYAQKAENQHQSPVPPDASRQNQRN